jgi:hypothetical protein
MFYARLKEAMKTVKTDNDPKTCLFFRNCIYDYIDEELQDSQKKDFLSHILQCPSCSVELKEAEKLKKVVSILPRVTVSPGFDFTLKARIRAEQAMLRKPWYRFNLYLRDNIAACVTITSLAAAALVFAFLNPVTNLNQPQMQAYTIINVQNTEDDPVDGQLDCELDMVESSDFEKGIFLNVGESEEQVSSNTNLKLVNF